MMKAFFAVALAVLVVLIGIRLWLNKEKAAERAKMQPISEIYKAREEALLKSQAQATEAITKIKPPAGSPTPAGATPTP